MFVVQSIKEALREINDNQRKQEETSENALKELVELFKSVTARLRDSDQASANQGLCSELLAEDIPMLVINHVILKKWDTAVDATILIAALLDFKMIDQHPAKQYFSSNFAVILEKILNGVETLSMADCTLEILVACVKHEEMAVPMLNLEMIRRLVQLIMADRKFADVPAAAQCILNYLLLLHKDVGAEFVLQNAAWTIEQLDGARRSVKIELWQVFKLFVAYPAKSPALKKLLIHHRKKLVKHARQMISDYIDRDDPEADEENFYVIKSLEELTED